MNWGKIRLECASRVAAALCILDRNVRFGATAAGFGLEAHFLHSLTRPWNHPMRKYVCVFHFVIM